MNKEVRRKWREKNKDKIKAYNKAAVALYYGCQNPSCKWQGSFFSAQLQFHHKERDSKEYSISTMGGMSTKRIAQEINKCCVLCACCHTAITWDLAQIDSNIGCNVNDRLEWQ